ncbi:hypothetical protein SLA2020_269620 [Shorea laevis]
MLSAESCALPGGTNGRRAELAVALRIKMFLSRATSGGPVSGCRCLRQGARDGRAAYRLTVGEGVALRMSLLRRGRRSPDPLSVGSSSFFFVLTDLSLENLIRRSDTRWRLVALICLVGLSLSGIRRCLAGSAWFGRFVGSSVFLLFFWSSVYSRLSCLLFRLLPRLRSLRCLAFLLLTPHSSCFVFSALLSSILFYMLLQFPSSCFLLLFLLLFFSFLLLLSCSEIAWVF